MVKPNEKCDYKILSLEDSLTTLLGDAGEALSKVISWINKDYTTYVNAPHCESLEGKFSSAVMLLGIEKNIRGDGLCANVWVLGKEFKRASVQDVRMSDGQRIKINAFPDYDIGIDVGDSTSVAGLFLEDGTDCEAYENGDGVEELQCDDYDPVSLANDAYLNMLWQKVLSESLDKNEFEMIVNVFGLLGSDAEKVATVGDGLGLSEKESWVVYEGALRKLESALLDIGIEKKDIGLNHG